MCVKRITTEVSLVSVFVELLAEFAVAVDVTDESELLADESEVAVEW